MSSLPSSLDFEPRLGSRVRAELEEGRGGLVASGEQEGEEVDGVAHVQLAVVVQIAGHLRLRLRPLEEEVAQKVDRVGEIEKGVLVDVAPAEVQLRRHLDQV